MLLLLTALPVGLLGIWVQKTTLDRELETVHEKHLLLATNLAGTLEHYVKDLRYWFGKLAHQNPTDPFEREIDRLYFRLKYTGYRTYDRIGAVVGSHLFRSDNILAIPQEVVAAGWINVTKQKIFVHPVRKNNSGLPRFYLSGDVGNGLLMVAEIRTDFIQELQSKIQFGNTGHSAIVDQIGKVIAHPNSQWVREARDISRLSPIAAMMKGETGVMEFFSPATGKQMITGYTTVPGVGWGVMIPQTLDELTMGISAIRNQLWSVLVAGVVLTAVFAWWFSGWIISPLHKITMTAAKMNSGDLGARVLPFVNVPAREFLSLGAVFDQMAQSMQNSYAMLRIRLEKHNLENLDDYESEITEGRVLVVDDSPVDVLNITGWLSKAGFTTFSALTNEDCLKIASVLQPDLAIVSVESSVTGSLVNRKKLIELLEVVNIPVVAIYPENMSAEAVEELDLNVVTAIFKPLQENRVTGLVADIQQTSKWASLDVKLI